jgi:hypothetical protein
MRDRLWQAIRRVWMTVGVALLMLAVLEGIGIAGIAFVDRDRYEKYQRAIGGAYWDDGSAVPEWTAEYVPEFFASYKTQWHPYVYWRRKPFRGRHINVDERGIRRTWNGTPSPTPDALKVFMFGGSTLWGEGARDDFTIPSLVSKRLTDRVRRSVWVTNFGESGYVSTQEVIALMLELRKGNVPNLVLFYDGVNEGAAAFQAGAAGIPLNEFHRVAEFNLRSRPNLLDGFVKQLASYRFIRSVADELLPGVNLTAYPGEDSRRIGALANHVVDVYLQNIDLVRLLAHRHGFDAMFFWQPSVFTKKNLTEWERQAFFHEKRPVRAGRFHGEVHKVLRARASTDKLPNLQDLSGVFDDYAGGRLFIDHYHVTEAGNERVADAIVQALQDYLRRSGN